MNQVIQGTVRELEPRYKDKSDAELMEEIRMEFHAGEALFYLLFGRYAEMLQSIFWQQATPSMDFDDFMLELDIRLYANHCAAIHAFTGEKASFRTYLSKIAHNLLYDLRKKLMPTLDVSLAEYDMPGEDGSRMQMLVDAINKLSHRESRYILIKTIEGYKSKEIAEMLSGLRHEQGTLKDDVQLKPSYVDTLRSRALKEIRDIILSYELPLNGICCCMPMRDADVDMMTEEKSAALFEDTRAYDNTNLFISNICALYEEMMGE